MVRYTIEKCRYGQVLIAIKGSDVCFISLMDDDVSTSVEEFLQLFPKAIEENSDETVTKHFLKVLEAIESPDKACDISLDPGGTDFQNIVWNVLRNIPSGTTLNYSEVALQLGRPKSARAVAKACASNKIAILIPCHRIIRKNGELSGYRWGEDRKRAILDHESGKL
ncbi:MAG: methylated-DNA--[protein]-cysteine S-methyltransferase [Alteromonadaceae bacterium]|nr:methylated-DNA--[protein]-cysteine S-methyltransferase [Alteromonadaceae bacterium]